MFTVLLCILLLDRGFSAVPPDRIRVTANPDYSDATLRTWVFGEGYRELWRAEIEVDYLDLDNTAGGLFPVRQVGQKQTPGLAFKGADGRSYTFRSVRKDPTRGLPEEYRDTLLAEIFKEQGKADIPAASLVAAGITSAVGMPTITPRLVVLPDDPILGEFREVFAGRLGTFEEFPTPVTFGAVDVIDSEDLFGRLVASREDQVDAKAFLTARLVDLLIGDWDRHLRQWRWIRYESGGPWFPFPEDRDHAFCRFDGMMMGMYRDAEPRFTVFGPDYADPEGNGWSPRQLDRRLLGGLDRDDWRRAAESIQASLDDTTIRNAVNRLPTAYVGIAGPFLIDTLQTRRDRLIEEALRFYEFLAEDVDLFGTQEADWIVINRPDANSLEISIGSAPDEGTNPCNPPPDGWAPVTRRTFLADETRSVRVYTGAGADHIALVGETEPGPTVHLVGGGGENRLCLESGETMSFGALPDPAKGRGHRVGPDTWIAPGEPLERRLEADLVRDGAALDAKRDWGRTSYGMSSAGYRSALGVFVNWGRVWETFAFRKRPYAVQHIIRAGWAFGPMRPRISYDGDYRMENSNTGIETGLLVSGVETLRFFGLGNETVKNPVKSYNDVARWTGKAKAQIVQRFGEFTTVSGGAEIRHTSTADEGIMADLEPYGSEDTTQLGFRAGYRYSRRVEAENRQYSGSDDPRRWGLTWEGPGLGLRVEGKYFPGWIDLVDDYGFIRAEGSVSWELSPAGPVLDLRLGGQKNWGLTPYYDSAFVGSRQVRGLDAQRYAGDASLYGSLVLRVPVGDVRILVPGNWGILARTDTGRVWLSGESSDRWHSSLGAGVWWHPSETEFTINLYVARSSEDTRGYLLFGRGF